MLIDELKTKLAALKVDITTYNLGDREPGELEIGLLLEGDIWKVYHTLERDNLAVAAVFGGTRFENENMACDLVYQYLLILNSLYENDIVDNYINFKQKHVTIMQSFIGLVLPAFSENIPSEDLAILREAFILWLKKEYGIKLIRALDIPNTTQEMLLLLFSKFEIKRWQSMDLIFKRALLYASLS